MAERETVRLKKSKLRYIARRSGRSLEELQAMLILADEQGRRITVTYDVVDPRK